MKKIEKQIDKLWEEIGKGLYTYKECIIKIKSIYIEVIDKYEEGTDKYFHLKSLLMDCQYYADEICNPRFFN